MTRFRLLLGLVSVGIAVGTIGCTKKMPSMQDLNDSNIQRLHSAYSIYMQRNDLTGPADADELKSFLNENQTAKVLLQRMGVNAEELDDIFTSERDNKPFKIRWGVKGLRDHAIIFEDEGVDGKRLVAFSRPRELESAEYEDYLSGKVEGAKPGGRTNDRSGGPDRE